MAYTKKVWKDAPDTSTPINAANLNHMEDGIATADVNAQNALDRLDDVDDEITQINSDLTERTTWVSKGSALGNTYISLPSNFSEVHIVVLLGSNDRIALNVLKDDLLPNQSTYFNDGYFMDNSHYCRVAIQFTSDNKVTLTSCFYNSTSNSASNTYFGVKVR